jgi:hypothetical protein
MILKDVARHVARAWGPESSSILEELVPGATRSVARADGHDDDDDDGGGGRGFAAEVCLDTARELPSKVAKEWTPDALASILYARTHRRPLTHEACMTTGTLVALWLSVRSKQPPPGDAGIPSSENGNLKLKSAVQAVLRLNAAGKDAAAAPPLMDDPYTGQAVPASVSLAFAEWLAAHYWEVPAEPADPVHALMYAFITRPTLRVGGSPTPSIDRLLGKFHAFLRPTKGTPTPADPWIQALHRHCQWTCLGGQRPRLSAYLDAKTDQTWLLSPSGRRVLMEGQAPPSSYEAGAALEPNVGPGHKLWTTLCLAVARNQLTWVRACVDNEDWQASGALVEAFRVALRYQNLPALDLLLACQQGRFRRVLLSDGVLPVPPPSKPSPWSYLTLLAHGQRWDKVKACLAGEDAHPTAVTGIDASRSRLVSERAFCEQHYRVPEAVGAMMRGALMAVDEPTASNVLEDEGPHDDPFQRPGRDLNVVTSFQKER